MELFQDCEDRLLYIRKVRGLLPFLFWKITSDWSSLLFLQFGAIGRPIFLETKDFKKHYHGDINCLKKQLAKNSINPSDNISSK